MSLRNYLGAIDQYLGDDDDLLGAAPRGGGRRMPTRRPQAGFGLNRAAAQAIKSPVAGVPNDGARVEPMGWPLIQFVNAGPTAISQISRPQKPFKGGRLVVEVARSVATLLQQVQITDVRIGSRPVFVNSNPIGAGAFGPGAFGVEMTMDESAAALDITFTCQIVGAALGAGETITVTPTLFGLTWS